MSVLSQFVAGASAIGDLKAVATGVSVDSSADLLLQSGQEWLKSGAALAYGSGYAHLVSSWPGLLRHELLQEASIGLTNYYQRSVVHHGGNYVFLQPGSYQPLSYKATLDGLTSSATQCPSLPGNPGQVVLLIPAGANAGRVVTINSSGAAHYMNSPTGGSWTAGSTGLLTNSVVGAVKADGGLLVVGASAQNAAGRVVTSTDGITWTSWTPSIGISGAYGIFWSETAARFFHLCTTGTGVYSSTDGFTFTSITVSGGPSRSTLLSPNVIADNGSAVLLVNTTGGVYRWNGTAFASILTAGFTSVTNIGSTFYATDSSNLVWSSTNNGDSWGVVSYAPIGYAAWGDATWGRIFCAANGWLFTAETTSDSYIRFETAVPSRAAPDWISPGTLTAPMTHARIK